MSINTQGAAIFNILFEILSRPVALEMSSSSIILKLLRVLFQQEQKTNLLFSNILSDQHYNLELQQQALLQFVKNIC